MARYTDTLRDQNGAPIAGALTSVLAPDGSTAVLTNNDGSPLTNPFSTDAYGIYNYNVAADGFYTNTFDLGGRTILKEVVIVGRTPVQEAVDAASLARLYAISDTDDPIPGAVSPSDRGAKYWADTAGQQVEDAVVEATALARAYAISDTDDPIPGAVDTTDRGSKFWADTGAAAVAGYGDAFATTQAQITALQIIVATYHPFP